MMQALLRGVVVFVRTSDARDFKERVLKLDASLLRLVWLPLSGNANKMHSIELEDLNVAHRRAVRRRTWCASAA